MTERIQAHALGQSFYDTPLRPGTDEPPYREILDRLPHGGADAAYKHLLAVQRFAQRRFPSYTMLRAFWPSILLNYNLDGLAADTCGDHHLVVPMHGSVPADYGSPAGREIARSLQEYRIELPYDGLHPIGPELVTDAALQCRLRYMEWRDATFAMIVGYSFGRFEGGYDDNLSLASFIRRFRDKPIDIYICDPYPIELAGMLGEKLRSKRVHTFPIYWNILASGFTQVLAGVLDIADLAFIHEVTLDRHGPSFLPAQD